MNDLEKVTIRWLEILADQEAKYERLTKPKAECMTIIDKYRDRLSDNEYELINWIISNLLMDGKYPPPHVVDLWVKNILEKDKK